MSKVEFEAGQVWKLQHGRDGTVLVLLSGKGATRWAADQRAGEPLRYFSEPFLSEWGTLAAPTPKPGQRWVCKSGSRPVYADINDLGYGVIEARQVNSGCLIDGHVTDVARWLLDHNYEYAGSEVRGIDGKVRGYMKEIGSWQTAAVDVTRDDSPSDWTPRTWSGASGDTITAAAARSGTLELRDGMRIQSDALRGTLQNVGDLYHIAWDTNCGTEVGMVRDKAYVLGQIGAGHWRVIDGSPQTKPSAVEVREGMRIRINYQNNLEVTARREADGRISLWRDNGKMYGLPFEISTIRENLDVGHWTAILDTPAVVVDPPHARAETVKLDPVATAMTITINGGVLPPGHYYYRFVVDDEEHEFEVKAAPSPRDRSRRAIDKQISLLSGRYAPAIAAVLRACAEKWDLTDDETQGAVDACYAWERARPTFAREWTEREKHAVHKAAGAAWLALCHRDTQFMTILPVVYERARAAC